MGVEERGGLRWWRAVLVLGWGVVLAGCGGSGSAANSDAGGVEAVAVNRVATADMPDVVQTDSGPMVLETPALSSEKEVSTAPVSKPAPSFVRLPSSEPQMITVHQGVSGLMVGQKTHSRAWVLRSQASWKSLWLQHVQTHPDDQPVVDVTDFRQRMVIGVAAWGADASGRVVIQSIVHLGPVMRVVFKVVGRCALDTATTTCPRHVTPVHHFLSVPRHSGAVQFVMASADEPEMSWSSQFCPAKSITWTVDGHVCSGRVERTAYTSQHTAFTVTPGMTGHQMLHCERNAAQAVWWTPWRTNPFVRDHYFFSFACHPTPPPPPPLTDPLEIATAKNCMMCHTVDGRDILGPSFKRVADFYRNNPPAEGQLELKVIRGGAGVFGTVPMPANSQIHDRELAIVVPWILGLP